MSQMILPGTYIDVLAEGLISPGQVTVGNVGVVGTASKGALKEPVLLSNYNDAVAIFGSYDPIVDQTKQPPALRDDALTLVRALELVFGFGANTVYAMRVADESEVPDDDSKKGWAKVDLTSASGKAATLLARSPGTWGNSIHCDVSNGTDSDVRMYNETKTAVAGNPKVTLKYAANPSTRNRVVIWKIAGGIEPVEIVDAPAAGRPVRQAQLAGTTLTFADPLNAGDKVDVTYVLKAVVNVKLTLGALTESYLVHDGNMLVSDIQNPESPSSLVTAVAGDKPDEAPKEQKATFIGGANGKAFRDYLNAQTYAPLLDVDAHIIVAAGQNDRTAGAGLDQHCQKASTDEYKRDRIAVVGSKRASGTSTEQIVGFVNELIGNTLASDRLVFVTPGIVATSSAPEDQKYNPITLPGAYAAAAIAGMLAATPPHVSLTNKPVAVADVEVRFTNAQLEELVQNRVTALEMDRGFRVLRGQTTDSGPFREITTRRIVDYAKYGVRSAAAPFIGLLNNERVRSALRASINSFLQSMLDGEMLVSYGIDVTATRDQQIRGIVQVTIALQPVFSINFIQVTMILS